jgi:formylglycine-generating enzyme required for sulfatase activity
MLRGLGWVVLIAITLGGCAQLAGVSEDYYEQSDSSTGGSGGGNAGDGSVEGEAAAGCDGGAQPIGANGESCCTPNELACAGHAQKLVLICDPKSHSWSGLQSCSGKQLCDSSAAANQGSCQDPVPICIGKKPGDKVCDGLKAIECGPDLLTSTETNCANACINGACQGECKAQDRQCSASTPQVCTSEGAWQSEAPCTYACADKGECTGVCTPAARQCSGKTPQQCDGNGQWVDGAACANVCSNGTCIGSCVPAAKQCNGSTPQTCDSNGAWQNGAPCPYVCSGQDCTGVCTPAVKECNGKVPQSCDNSGSWVGGSACANVCSAGICVSACNNGDKQCSGKVPQSCVGGTWQDEAACTHVCKAGNCIGLCDPSSTQCSGLTPQRCDATGEWQSGTACQYVCASGACTGVCKPGSKQCSGQVAQSCDTTGQWQDDQTCPYLCNAGACTGSCSPGSKQCSALVPQTCDAQGSWQSGTECQYVCATGACTGVCAPGGKDCQGLTPRSCDPSGQWQSSAPCAYVCSSGACTGVCTPESKQCSGQTPQTCDSSGQWQNATPCPYVCTAATCAGSCAQGAKQCNELVPQTCDAQGTWQNDAACQYVCANGSCTGVCTPGTKQCSGSTPQTCGSSGTWQDGAACSGAAPVCSAGACTVPLSCNGLAANCGANGNAGCCTSNLVTGNYPSGSPFYRSYDGVTYTSQSYPARVSDFKLDVYEITVGRFRKFVQAGYGTQQHPPADGSGANPNLAASGWQASSWNTKLAATTSALTGTSGIKCHSGYETWTDSAASNENRPITCITWFEAFAFCIWDGGRIPTEAEWNYAAAGGTEQRVYPWGSTVPGNNTNLAVYRCYYNGGGTCTGVTNIAPVGSVTAGNGKWGQADLAGNVWEWNLDWHTDYANPCDNCASLTSASTERMIRNGCYYSNASVLFSSYHDDYLTPVTRYNSVGARCARAP